MQYLVKLPGLVLTTGGEALVGEKYAREDFRTTNFTFARRLEQGWIIETEQPVIEPEPEPELEAKPKEGTLLDVLDEVLDDEDDETDGLVELRMGLNVQEWWDSSEEAGGRSRLCRHCGDKISSKSVMFDHCRDQDSEEE